MSADQLRAVKLPIASVTTGTEVAQKLDLSKPLTNIQKTEAIGLILQNIGQGNLVEEIAAEMNQKLKRTGRFASTPFTQMDYLNALTAVGGQTLLNAVREADYRPYQITGEDSTRRKVSSLVTPTYESEDYRRELSKVTKDKGKDEGMDVFMEGELQESASVDVKAAQTMFNLFLPPSELLAINKLALQIGRETDLGKKESLRHELVKKRQMGYIALLQANGVKGYEANGPIVKELISKGVLTAEEVNSIQGKMVGRIEKIMTKKGIHELSLHDANIDSLVQITSENYITRKKTGTVQKAVRNAFDSIEISRDAITKLEDELGEKGFSKSQRTRKAYEQLWKQFNGALTQEGLALKKGETPQETTDTEEALKLFFFDRVRTELGMTERKIKFESGYKNPSDVRLSEVEDWGIKGLDLLYRRTQSTQVYKDVGDYDEKIRTLLQKMALGEEQREEKKPTALVQETPKKLDEKTEAQRKTLEKNLPNTPAVENLPVEQAVKLSQALEQVIDGQLRIGQEPSAVLLDEVAALVATKKAEHHQAADLLFRIVLGESVRTPAGRVVIDKLLPQILERLKDQPQRLGEIIDVIDGQQQNEETPDAVANKLGALVEKYAPAEEPKPPSSAADLSWLTPEPPPPTAVGAPSLTESAAATTPAPESKPLTATHGILEVTKDANGLVIKQLKPDDLTGNGIFDNGRDEFAFTHGDINAAIGFAESNLNATLRLGQSDPLRNTKVHNEGLVVDALYEYKRAEVAQTLEPHLADLGIDKDKVSSKVVGNVVVFEVADQITLPFSDETSKQLKALNEAATTAQGVEVHVAQLNLAPVEKVGEKPVDLQLPAEVGTMVAKAGAEGAIGINRVGTVQLEGKTNVILNKGGEGKSSVGAIEITDESALTISPQLAKDLNGQKVRLNLPESQTGLQGYVGPGEYVVETTEKGDITVRPSLPIGGTQPPRPPPSSAPPPQPTSAEDLDIPAFLRRRAGSSTFPPPTLSSTPPAPTTPTPFPTAATAAPATVTPPPSEPHTESPPEKKPGFREKFKKFVNEHVEKPPRPLNDEQVLVSNLEFEPETTNHLQAITARFNLEDSPENNKIKDALAEELNKLAEGKHKEKELPAFVESLLADQEAAVQFVDAIHQYADDYNERTKRSFLQKKLSIISHRATPMREDAFGVDHIFLDRMTDDLVHEVNRRQITTAFTYGRPHADLEIYDDRRDFIHDVMLRLELNQGESSTELAIKTIQALLNIPDEQFSDLQRETVISLEELVGDVSGSDQTIALKTVITDRLSNTFEAYARKYNQERGGRIRNKNPFRIDFPELANLLDKSA